jgi:hypothetical protein
MQELFEQCGTQMSGELEEIVPALLRKAGEVGSAGRDNFLAQYADAALSQMVLSCPETLCAKALVAMCASTPLASFACPSPPAAIPREASSANV